MSTISIGNDQRDLRDADRQWITQEINGRRRDGQSICVVVRIDEAEVSLVLCSPACRLGGGGGGGGGRAPNARERAILDLWSKRGLNDGDVEPGEVVAFLQQLRHLL